MGTLGVSYCFPDQWYTVTFELEIIGLISERNSEIEDMELESNTLGDDFIVYFI